MKKILFGLFVSLFLSTVASAAETPIPSVSGMEYTITIKKIEMFNSTTNLWVTITGSSTSFDIASVNAGATAGNMVSGANLPNGSYTRIRVTVSNQFRIKAFVSISGQGKCTSGTGVIGTNTFAGVVNCASIASASAVTATIDFSSNPLPAGNEVVGTDLRTTSEIPSFVIGLGSVPKTADISFDLNNVFKHYTAGHFSPGSAEVITPGQPNVTQSME